MYFMYTSGFYVSYLFSYTGVDMSSLSLSIKIAESHSGELWRGKWQGNDIVARILAIPDVTPRISREFQSEFPALRCYLFFHLKSRRIVILFYYKKFGHKSTKY